MKCRISCTNGRVEYLYTRTHANKLSTEFIAIVHLRSVDSRKLRVGVNYYIVHMYSMPYYTYGSTANFLCLEPTALQYIYQKNDAVTRIHMVLDILKLNE